MTTVRGAARRLRSCAPPRLRETNLARSDRPRFRTLSRHYVVSVAHSSAVIVLIGTSTVLGTHQEDVSMVGTEQYDSAAAKLIGFVEGVWNQEALVLLKDTTWVVFSAMRSIRGRGALLAVDVMAEHPAFEIEWSPDAETGRRSA